MNPHLHELAILLVALGQAGIELAPHPTDPDRLRHRPEQLPPDLLARLRMQKGPILELLVNGYTPAPNEAREAEHTMNERLGIADELGMPTHPGSPAWLIAVGETMGCRCD